MKIKIEYNEKVIEYDKELMCEYDSNELYNLVLPHIIEGKEEKCVLNISIESNSHNEFDEMFSERVYTVLGIGKDREPDKVEIRCDNWRDLFN